MSEKPSVAFTQGNFNELWRTVENVNEFLRANDIRERLSIAEQGRLELRKDLGDVQDRVSSLRNDFKVLDTTTGVNHEGRLNGHDSLIAKTVARLSIVEKCPGQIVSIIKDLSKLTTAHSETRDIVDVHQAQITGLNQRVADLADSFKKSHPGEGMDNPNFRYGLTYDEYQNLKTLEFSECLDLLQKHAAAGDKRIADGIRQYIEDHEYKEW